MRYHPPGTITISVFGTDDDGAEARGDATSPVEAAVVVVVGTEATAVEAEATTVAATEVDGVIVVVSPMRVSNR